MDISKISDRDIVATTICAEAGGEPWAGKVMVGAVIANRALQSGKSIRAVCLAPRQFSCWNNRRTMSRKMAAMMKSTAWNDSARVADTVCQPGYKAVSPATHYFNPKLAKPSWGRKLIVVAVVGNHIFFRG